MSIINYESRMQVAENYHQWTQEGTERVLCVCTGGILRSATASAILAGEPYNFNTRAVGVDKRYALVAVDDRRTVFYQPTPLGGASTQATQ